MVDLREKSEIVGSAWTIELAVGDSVAEEDPLLAPHARIIKDIPVAEGDVAVPVG